MIQEAKAAKHFSENPNGPMVFDHRDFRMLLAARNQLEDKFYSTLEQLQGPKLWMLMPDIDCTEKMAALGFRM